MDFDDYLDDVDDYLDDVDDYLDDVDEDYDFIYDNTMLGQILYEEDKDEIYEKVDNYVTEYVEDIDGDEFKANKAKVMEINNMTSGGYDNFKKGAITQEIPLSRQEESLLKRMYNSKFRKGKELLKKSGEIGKSLLKKLGKKAPVIGVCICLGSAAAYAEEGNYSKAIAEAAGAIPVVGDFAEGGHALYTYLTTDHLELGGSGSENGVDANLTYKSSEITEGSGIESLPEDYNGELLYGGEGKDGGDPNNWRQAIVEEGKEQPSGSGNTEGGIEAQEGQSSGQGVSAQEGQAVAKEGDKVAQKGDVIATDPTKVAKENEQGATIFDGETQGTVGNGTQETVTNQSTQSSEPTNTAETNAEQSAVQSTQLETTGTAEVGTKPSVQNAQSEASSQSVTNVDENVAKIMTSATTYYHSDIAKYFSNEKNCKDLLGFLDSKGIQLPSDPEKIFETIYFTKEGNAMITFYTDKDGKNFLGTSPEQREELRDEMKRRREVSGATGRLSSVTHETNTSGNASLDNALAKRDAAENQPVQTNINTMNNPLLNNNGGNSMG